MNNVILLGRLVEDPEVRYTQSGTAVVNFTMAVDRPGKDKGTDFIPIVAWNKLAEIIGNNLSKGRRTLIEGNLRVSSYEKDGQIEYASVVAPISKEAREELEEYAKSAT